jgi:hypothetical protein
MFDMFAEIVYAASIGLTVRHSGQRAEKMSSVKKQ